MLNLKKEKEGFGPRQSAEMQSNGLSPMEASANPWDQRTMR